MVNEAFIAESNVIFGPVFTKHSQIPQLGQRKVTLISFKHFNSLFTILHVYSCYFCSIVFMYEILPKLSGHFTN